VRGELGGVRALPLVEAALERRGRTGRGVPRELQLELVPLGRQQQAQHFAAPARQQRVRALPRAPPEASGAGTWCTAGPAALLCDQTGVPKRSSAGSAANRQTGCELMQSGWSSAGAGRPARQRQSSAEARRRSAPPAARGAPPGWPPAPAASPAGPPRTPPGSAQAGHPSPEDVCSRTLWACRCARASSRPGMRHQHLALCA